MSHPSAEQPLESTAGPELSPVMDALSLFDRTREGYLGICVRYADQQDPRDIPDIYDAEFVHRRAYRETLIALGNETPIDELARCALRLLEEQDAARGQYLNRVLGKEVLEQMDWVDALSIGIDTIEDDEIGQKRKLVCSFSWIFDRRMTDDTAAFLAAFLPEETDMECE